MTPSTVPFLSFLFRVSSTVRGRVQGRLVITYTCLTNAFFRAILVTVSVELIERSVMRVSKTSRSCSVDVLRWSKVERSG